MRIFSGIQPTGRKHLGNYIGAIAQYVSSQERGEGIFCIVDLHAITVAYEPAALMWHNHRQDMASLNKQLQGYSVGLTAFYAALLRHRPGALLGLVKLLPMAASYLRPGKGAPDEAPEEPQDLAAELDRRSLQGMLKGPLLYSKSRREQRRVAATARSR